MQDRGKLVSKSTSNNSITADAEGASSSSKDEIIRGLNEDWQGSTKQLSNTSYSVPH